LYGGGFQAIVVCFFKNTVIQRGKKPFINGILDDPVILLLHIIQRQHFFTKKPMLQ
jgi:hypothetical protein